MASLLLSISIYVDNNNNPEACVFALFACLVHKQYSSAALQAKLSIQKHTTCKSMLAERDRCCLLCCVHCKQFALYKKSLVKPQILKMHHTCIIQYGTCMVHFKAYVIFLNIFENAVLHTNCSKLLLVSCSFSTIARHNFLIG